MNIYKNGEGYIDPTAGKALSNVIRDYKRKQRQLWKEQHEMKHRRKVYIASPYAGETERNRKEAIRYCRFAVAQGKQPVASHLMYPQFLANSDPAQRQLGMMFGQALLALCNEVWVFGSNITEGMQGEINEARRLHIRTRYFDEDLREVRQ